MMEEKKILKVSVILQKLALKTIVKEHNVNLLKHNTMIFEQYFGQN